MLVKLASSLFFGLAMATSPAMAEDTIITTPAEGIIQIDSVASGAIEAASNEEFGNLFASWEALDHGAVTGQDGLILPAPRFSVSVPSRMPVENVKLTSGYGMRDHPILRKRARHNGVDLAAVHGTPVYATADGMIGKAQYWGSYGNYVQIEHGGALETRYGHLSAYVVAAGDIVHKGELIGYVGSTGRSTGPHLHYEVRVEGEPVDPRPYMLADLEVARDGIRAAGGPE